MLNIKAPILFYSKLDKDLMEIEKTEWQDKVITLIRSDL
jgi:hypothetical protein